MNKNIRGGLLILGLGLVSVFLGMMAPALASGRAGADAPPAIHTLATAPMAIPENGVMECTLANLHGRPIEFTIRQHHHFRNAFSFLPNDAFVIEKTETVGPGQSTALGGTVGSDPAIIRCTFEFEGARQNIRAAAVVLEDVFGFEQPDFSFIVIDGRAVAALEAR